MRRLWPFTARGTGAVLATLGLIVGGYALGARELLYVAVVFAALIAFALLALFATPKAITATRSVTPDLPRVGEELGVRAHVTIRTGVPLMHPEWSDTLPEGSTLLSEMRREPGASNGELTVVYSARAHTRGIHRLGPIVLTQTDPFGLVRRTQSAGEPTTIAVAPALVELPPLPDAPGDSGGLQHAVRNEWGEGADNLTPRPYVSGDSMRRIHWRASAHRDELMVRQEEQEAAPDATVIFDRAAARYGVGAGIPGLDDAFETAVAAWIAVVTRLVSDGYRVTVMDADGAEFGEPIDGTDVADLNALALTAATVSAVGADTSFAGAISALSGAGRGPIVVITGATDTAEDAELRQLSALSSLPLLLSAQGSADGVSSARSLGWHAAAMHSLDDISAAWQHAGWQSGGQQ